jgi:hypothetical protein
MLHNFEHGKKISVSLYFSGVRGDAADFADRDGASRQVEG